MNFDGVKSLVDLSRGVYDEDEHICEEPAFVYVAPGESRPGIKNRHPRMTEVRIVERICNEIAEVCHMPFLRMGLGDFRQSVEKNVDRVTIPDLGFVFVDVDIQKVAVGSGKKLTALEYIQMLKRGVDVQRSLTGGGGVRDVRVELPEYVPVVAVLRKTVKVEVGDMAGFMEEGVLDSVCDLREVHVTQWSQLIRGAIDEAIDRCLYKD